MTCQESQKNGDVLDVIGSFIDITEIRRHAIAHAYARVETAILDSIKNKLVLLVVMSTGIRFEEPAQRDTSNEIYGMSIALLLKKQSVGNYEKEKSSTT